jgi:hypothetical protein
MTTTQYTSTSIETYNTRSGAIQIKRVFKVIEWTAADVANHGEMAAGISRIEYVDEFVGHYGSRRGFKRI